MYSNLIILAPEQRLKFNPVKYKEDVDFGDIRFWYYDTALKKRI
jgi:hypothetical protein